MRNATRRPSFYIMVTVLVIVAALFMPGLGGTVIGDDPAGEHRDEGGTTFNGVDAGHTRVSASHWDWLAEELRKTNIQVRKTNVQVQALGKESAQAKMEAAQAKEDRAGYESRLDEFEAPLAQFVELLQNRGIWTPMVTILGTGPKGDPQQAQGVLINPSTIVSIRHLPEAIEKEHGSEAKVKATFEFLDGKPEFALGKPIYLLDGLFVYYTLSEKATKRVKDFNITYPILASEAIHSELSMGDTLFRLSYNFSSLSKRGSLIAPAIVEFVDYKKTVWRFLIAGFDEVERYSGSIGITGAVNGDSGSLLVVFNERVGAFVVVALTDTFVSAMNVHILADSLREEGISFVDAESLVKQQGKDLDSPSGEDS